MDRIKNAFPKHRYKRVNNMEKEFQIKKVYDDLSKGELYRKWYDNTYHSAVRIFDGDYLAQVISPDRRNKQQLKLPKTCEDIESIPFVFPEKESFFVDEELCSLYVNKARFAEGPFSDYCSRFLEGYFDVVTSVLNSDCLARIFDDDYTKTLWYTATRLVEEGYHLVEIKVG